MRYYCHWRADAWYGYWLSSPFGAFCYGHQTNLGHGSYICLRSRPGRYNVVVNKFFPDGPWVIIACWKHL